MCGSMVDIQSPTAEIRRGKEKIEITGQKYNGLLFLHRATITTLCPQKSVLDLCCYNFDTHEAILVIFGRDVTKKVIRII